MPGAFVHCPTCGRWMIGQVLGSHTYPQPHECEHKETPDA